MPDQAFKTRPSLTLKRRFTAPPEKVFEAWTEPAKLAQWFGPDEGRVMHAATDVREGGLFRIVFVTLNGEQHDVSGVYREVVANEKLVFTWTWRTMPERQSQVTVSLKAEGGNTILTLLHEQFFDEDARDRHRTGWTGTLDKLEKYLA